MSEIEPPDSHHLSAAAGWIELGLPDEARQELNRLTPGARNHPDALAIEWDLHARAGAWENALAVATKLVEVDSDRPAGWINRSYALHELRRTAEARESLLAALPMFPSLGIIPYNLACYACQLGDLEAARSWLRRSMSLEGRDTVIARARKDPDLKPLRPELSAL
jgi:Flp pilus assembly protein TadD